MFANRTARGLQIERNHRRARTAGPAVPTSSAELLEGHFNERRGAIPRRQASCPTITTENHRRDACSTGNGKIAGGTPAPLRRRHGFGAFAAEVQRAASRRLGSVGLGYRGNLLREDPRQRVPTGAVNGGQG